MIDSPRSRAFRLAGLLLSVLVLAVALCSSAMAAGSESVTVILNPVNDSGASGVAVLTASGNKTVVDLTLSGLAGDHPNHIHAGTCADPNPEPLYPLTNIVLKASDAEGHSRTIVDVPLKELLDGKFLILIHKSKKEIGTYVACGDISGAAVGGATNMPTTGSGLLRHPGTARSLPLLVILALGCGLFFLAVRRAVASRANS